ncbi:hypothetical protein [Clostridium aminobutyricum]|nr:hypothetical protein [Clostridium aminobutyricum]
MPLSIFIPIQVFGIGAVIAFGIAVLIKFMLDAIIFLTKKPKKQ